MMLEGLARIRVEEAIRTGLKEQHTRRNLPPERRSNLMGYLRILVLVLTITILSTGCSAIAAQPHRMSRNLSLSQGRPGSLSR